MLDTMINKILKPLSNQEKQTVKRIIRQPNTSLEEKLTRISCIVSKAVLVPPPNENRQDFIVSKIHAYLSSQMTLSSYSFADIGGGNGNVLQLLHQEIHPSKNQTLSSSKTNSFVCVETKTDWVETYPFDCPDITYVFWDNQALPTLGDESMDVVLCMVSLHHMTDATIATALKEIGRILKPNGILLVKEHDATEEAMNWIEWEHHLYHVMDIAITKPQLFTTDGKRKVEQLFIDYLNHHIANFKPQEEWKRLIQEHAMVAWKETTNRFLDGSKSKDPRNPSNLYWDVFIKQGFHTHYCWDKLDAKLL